MSELQLVGLLSLILIVTTIVLTYRSALVRDIKIMLYILSLLAPPIAFLLFLVFYFKNRRR